MLLYYIRYSSIVVNGIGWPLTKILKSVEVFVPKLEPNFDLGPDEEVLLRPKSPHRQS
jgi:hypothetical protein